ncbi:hypothetical protein WN48_00655 [Eufriesea mexicana]|uniref:Uncharacterized protein n=1 Tax=Eufriesea mexicana TaxID=516756 RepID=A0A310SRP4_9HYME|nr:hypothetical protein WN48_00655 [Eufriesea mexicana]
MKVLRNKSEKNQRRFEFLRFDLLMHLRVEWMCMYEFFNPCHWIVPNYAFLDNVCDASE